MAEKFGHPIDPVMISANRTVRYLLPSRYTLASQPLVWSARSNSDVTDFTLDMTAWLADAGDTILNVDPPEPLPCDLQTTDPIIDGGLITVTLMYGSAGTYQVPFLIHCASGRIVEEIVTVETVTGLRPDSSIIWSADWSNPVNSGAYYYL